ncbi:MAG: hypothetical protein IPM57_09215 [Oligoflexia bacterium]|nr:hypothetical protein [Oligoflexia bacterium]
METLFQGRKTVLISIAVFFLTQFQTLQTLAAESKPFFRNVRAQSMGGAAVATVNDESALFLNPAGLGKLRGGYVALVNPEIETNYETVSAIGANYSAVTAFLNPQAMHDLALRNPDKPMHMKLQILPAFVTTNFGFGLLANYTSTAEYTTNTGLVQLDYKNDIGLVLGYCFRLLEGRLKIGISGKILNRVEVSQTVTAGSTGLTLNNIAREGTGIGWDLGVIMTAPWAWLPTLAIVAHDVGNTKFSMGNGYFYPTGNKPNDQYQSVDVGISVFPYDGKTTRTSFTVEWRDAQNPESQDIYRRIHTGLEVNFSDFIYLRAGMNQRYYTAGLEMSFDRQQLQLATYGEEIGTYPSYREDRRFIFMYGFRF